MGLHFNGVIFVDIETSGLNEGKNEIIQIAAIHGPTKDNYEQKIKFDERNADSKALELNHYTKEAWENALSQEQALKEFSSFCKRHTSIEKISKRGRPWYTAALSGYNINFDVKFLKYAYQKYEIFIPFDYRVYDVYEMAKWMYPDRRSYKLTDIAKFLGVYDENAHDAFADVRMTMVIAIEMMRQLALAGIPIPSWAKKSDGEDIKEVKESATNKED